MHKDIVEILHFIYELITLQKAIESDCKMCYILFTGYDIRFISIKNWEDENLWYIKWKIEE